ncbi:MAG TPA: hypothetical protein VFP71_05245 [Candidatus Angelobacter sp.]|nr:hypothetical protein [Candidatus Angelobacter sp.]
MAQEFYAECGSFTKLAEFAEAGTQLQIDQRKLPFVSSVALMIANYFGSA